MFKKKPIPGQPTNKKGKPYNYFVYEEAKVNVDDMDHVIEVQKAISNMGYEANSQMEWLEQSKQQSNMIQAALGGIGAASLLVGARPEGDNEAQRQYPQGDNADSSFR